MNPSDQNQPAQDQLDPLPQAPSPGTQIQPSLDSPQTPIQPVVLQPKGGGGLKKLLLIILALIVLGGIGYGVYAFTQKDSADTNKSAISKKSDIAQLNVGVIGGAVALYPDSTSDSYAQTVSQQIYEGLVAYEDQTKIVPLLATGWSNPDSSTWDFTLRKGVTFHNGNTMKAADVVSSLNAAKANENLSLYTDSLSDVKALSDYKVEIKTDKPDPFLLNKLTFLMVLDSKDPDGTDTMNATGPYKLKQGTEPTTSEIQLTAYDGYHGGHIYVRGLKIVDEVDEEAASKAFKEGKINMIGEFNSSDPELLKTVKAQKIVVDDPAVTFMTVNSVAPGPLQNLKVRQALKYSINIPGVIKGIDAAAEPASQLITKAIPGYDPSISVGNQDIAKAKQLLTEAGYPNGVSIDVEISSVNTPTAQQIISQAKEAGITLNLVTVPSFDILVDDLLSGKSQTIILSYSSDLQDGSEVFDTVLRQTGNYKSTTLDGYLDEASSTVDQAKRLKVLQKASKSINDDVGAIPLYNRQRIWLTDKPYAVQFDTLSSDPGVYFWKVYLTN